MEIRVIASPIRYRSGRGEKNPFNLCNLWQKTTSTAFKNKLIHKFEPKKLSILASQNLSIFKKVTKFQKQQLFV